MSPLIIYLWFYLFRYGIKDYGSRQCYSFFHSTRQLWRQSVLNTLHMDKFFLTISRLLNSLFVIFHIWCISLNSQGTIFLQYKCQTQQFIHSFDKSWYHSKKKLRVASTRLHNGQFAFQKRTCSFQSEACLESWYTKKIEFPGTLQPYKTLKIAKIDNKKRLKKEIISYEFKPHVLQLFRMKLSNITLLGGLVDFHSVGWILNA